MPTTAADHAAIITAFNTASNTSRSKVFYELLGQEKDSFALVLPSATEDRTSGITVQTPKGLQEHSARVAAGCSHGETARGNEDSADFRRSTKLPIGTSPPSRANVSPIAL